MIYVDLEILFMFLQDTNFRFKQQIIEKLILNIYFCMRKKRDGQINFFYKNCLLSQSLLKISRSALIIGIILPSLLNKKESYT